MQMKIKVSFNKPEYVSSGILRDKLVVKVKNPIFFFSKES